MSGIQKVAPPLLGQGGYIPFADGRVREDVPFEYLSNLPYYPCPFKRRGPRFGKPTSKASGRGDYGKLVTFTSPEETACKAREFWK
jgi:hypothetical protein